MGKNIRVGYNSDMGITIEWNGYKTFNVFTPSSYSDRDEVEIDCFTSNVSSLEEAREAAQIYFDEIYKEMSSYNSSAA